MTEREYTIILTPDEKQGGYTATVPALPECVVEGGTLDEAIANAQDAIQDYIDALVKEHAVLVGLDPTRYAGHSLRAGLATSAADGGASDRAIMRQTGHRSAAMINRYVRQGRLFRDNAALLAGL